MPWRRDTLGLSAVGDPEEGADSGAPGVRELARYAAAMLFLVRFWPGLRDGSITLTFRAWSSALARAGSRHRLGSDGFLEITSVERVSLASIPPADLAAAGFEDLAALRTTLHKAARRTLADEDLVYRVGLRYVAERDPRLTLGEAPPTGDELATLIKKLDRMDRERPWTLATLEILAARPEESAKHLAADLGRERDPFKIDVRKLKKHGLTISCDVGYRLSVRGVAVLEALRSRSVGPRT